MLRSVRAAAVAVCSFVMMGSIAQAQAPKRSSAPALQTSPQRSVTMQIRVTITGSLLYRLIPKTGVATVPIPVPAASSAAPVAAIPLPSNMPARGTILELIDRSTGKIARLPVQTKSVTTVSDSSFTLVQTVLVPVEVQNKGGLTDATVTLTSGPPTYQQQWTLKPADAGVAQFTNVPLTDPVTVKIVNGTDPPVVQTQTLPSNPPADGYQWPVIYVTWADAHTVPLRSAVAAPATGTTTPVPTPASGSSAPVGSSLNRLVSMVVSVGLLGLLGWGLYIGYQRGHIKKVLEGMGVVLPPPDTANSTPQVSPFDPRERSPIIPITEGVVDPLAGAQSNATPSYSGTPSPRLIAKAGSYSGSSYPLGGSIIQIGREASCDISLATDANVSRKHATISSAGGTYNITDNGSSNGTFVNGTRLVPNEATQLTPGDEVHIGNTRFRFEL